jgi:hypothetical protein
MQDCSCQDWKEGMPQIEGAQVLAHTHGTAYTGKVFLYCPWCGKKRGATT